MILIQDAIDAINCVRDDAIVVGTMTPNRYWASVSDNSDLDLPIFGAMGKASSVALGLALSKSLTELHDGTLSLEREPGVGTTVTLRFPSERTLVTQPRLPLHL